MIQCILSAHLVVRSTQVYISKEEYDFWTADNPKPKPPLMPLDIFNTLAFYAKQALTLVRRIRAVVNPCM